MPMSLIVPTSLIVHGRVVPSMPNGIMRGMVRSFLLRVVTHGGTDGCRREEQTEDQDDRRTRKGGLF